jgi:tRNA (cmo5U34)-methyltransferase
VLHDWFGRLVPGGVMILVEKLSLSSDELAPHFMTQYHHFKHQNGYTWAEISRKQMALEGVLQPWTFQENQSLLENTGFTIVESFFRWYNFAGWIGLK